MNLQPSVLETDALPIELLPYMNLARLVFGPFLPWSGEV